MGYYKLFKIFRLHIKEADKFDFYRKKGVYMKYTTNN